MCALEKICGFVLASSNTLKLYLFKMLPLGQNLATT